MHPLILVQERTRTHIHVHVKLVICIQTHTKHTPVTLETAARSPGNFSEFQRQGTCGCITVCVCATPAFCVTMLAVFFFFFYMILVKILPAYHVLFVCMYKCGCHDAFTVPRPVNKPTKPRYSTNTSFINYN